VYGEEEIPEGSLNGATCAVNQPIASPRTDGSSGPGSVSNKNRTYFSFNSNKAPPPPAEASQPAQKQPRREKPEGVAFLGGCVGHAEVCTLTVSVLYSQFAAAGQATEGVISPGYYCM
jgi:hypothetical protein